MNSAVITHTPPSVPNAAPLTCRETERATGESSRRTVALHAAHVGGMSARSGRASVLRQSHGVNASNTPAVAGNRRAIPLPLPNSQNSTALPVNNNGLAVVTGHTPS